MPRTSHADQQTEGDVILARLAETSVPAALKKHVADFKKVHGALVAACDAADAAHAKRDDAMRAIASADDSLDATVTLLADKMVGAGLGTRKNAFAKFSPHAPGALTELAYATEVKEVRALAAKVKKAKPSADVVKAVAACEKLAAKVDAAIKALTAPQLAFTKAMSARDALLLDWMKSLVKLKRKALGEWFDDDAKYKSIFAAPERVQAPKRTVNHPAAPVTPPAPAAPSA